jgi:two-component system, OmpR family, sensor histidine kinase VicK
MIGVDAIKNERLKAKKRGVSFRYITEIINENVAYCKELSKFAEVRHLNGVKGNFEVSKNGIRVSKGGEYIGTATLQEAEPIAQLIFSNVKEIVEQQQFVFDTMWNKAIPFEVRIKEIEEGIQPESIEIIVDPKQALEAEYRLLNSAKEEVQMIFSSVNTFHLQQRQLGIIQILCSLSKQGVRIRVLTPIDNDVKELLSDLKKQQDEEKYHLQKEPYQKNNAGKNHNRNSNTDANSIIDIQDIAPSSSINAKIIVVDKQDSLVMEIKDGIKDNLDDTIGLSTYSNSKSTVASYSAIFENLSKQNQLYKELRKAYQKVENTNAMQREFINIAAHELRTPIQPILGYAELLLEEEIDDRKKHALMGIVHNSERLEKLASDILDVARIESNTFQLNKKSLNLCLVISNIVKNYVKRQVQLKTRDDISRLISNVNANNNKNNNEGKNRETKLFFESKLKEDVFVQADEERLTQVISNMLDNAFKFSDADGNVQITLEKQELQPLQLEEQQQEQEEELRHAVIHIKDTGTGIHPEILQKLFSKFASKSHKGTGLGLYISKNIVEAHGGKLYGSNNTDGKGATFVMILPLSNNEQK